jgi:hypothetical protein
MKRLSNTPQLVATATLAMTAFAASAQQPTVPTTESVPTPTQPAAPAASVVAPGMAAATSPSFDRIVAMVNGSSLTGTNGGAGASLGWLHNFNADTLLGAAAEYETVSVSHWTFGSINGSITRGPSDQRYTLYGDVHEGAGDDGNKPFKYRVETLGLTGTYVSRVSATVEDKQINVETTHGNLPKLGVSYLWNLHVQTALSYQYSFGGNLGTKLTSGRIDIYGSVVNFLGGFAVGQTSPTVLGLAIPLPPRHLGEGYVGLVKSLPQWHSEVTLILDYQRLTGKNLETLNNETNVLVPSLSTRFIGTLNYVYHLNGM